MHPETLRLRFTMTPAVIADPLLRGPGFIEEELRRLKGEGWILSSKRYDQVGSFGIAVTVNLNKKTKLS